MKKQLVTAVTVICNTNCVSTPKIEVIGIVFYVRRTKILKRLVREIIYTVKKTVSYNPDATKEMVRKELDNYVYTYYNKK